MEAPQNKINSYQANHRQDNTKQRNHAITISYDGLNCFFINCHINTKIQLI